MENLQVVYFLLLSHHELVAWAGISHLTLPQILRLSIACHLSQQFLHQPYPFLPLKDVSFAHVQIMFWSKCTIMKCRMFYFLKQRRFHNGTLTVPPSKPSKVYHKFIISTIISLSVVAAVLLNVIVLERHCFPSQQSGQQNKFGFPAIKILALGIAIVIFTTPPHFQRFVENIQT